MKAVKMLRSQGFGLCVLASAGLALAFPDAFVSWGGVKLIALVPPAIQLIMFGMGTTLSGADFLRVARRPWAVAAGVGLQFLVMPLVGLLLARAFGLGGELAAGCVLVGAVAGGTASNVVAFLAKADVALSVTMTCCSTLLSPLATPLLMKLLAGRFVAVDAPEMMIGILKIVLVPVLAGALVHRLFRRSFATHKEACDRALSVLSMCGICFTLAAITAPCRDAFVEAGAAVVAVAVLHNTTGCFAGYWFVRLTSRFTGLGEREARTVAIEVGMQNGGMAAALAVGVLGSAVAALPANVFSIWMNFSGSILASIWRRNSPERAGREAAPCFVQDKRIKKEEKE